MRKLSNCCLRCGCTLFRLSYGKDAFRSYLDAAASRECSFLWVLLSLFELKKNIVIIIIVIITSLAMHVKLFTEWRIVSAEQVGSEQLAQGDQSQIQTCCHQVSRKESFHYTRYYIWLNLWFDQWDDLSYSAQVSLDLQAFWSRMTMLVHCVV